MLNCKLWPGTIVSASTGTNELKSRQNNVCHRTCDAIKPTATASKRVRVMASAPKRAATHNARSLAGRVDAARGREFMVELEPAS